MTTYREEHGACLIEAGAQDLDNGSHWQPWLKLTRFAGGACDCRTFDRLKPVFGTEREAVRYAAELGRTLIDEDSALVPASNRQTSANRPPPDASNAPLAFFARARAFTLASFPFQTKS